MSSSPSASQRIERAVDQVGAQAVAIACRPSHARRRRFDRRVQQPGLRRAPATACAPACACRPARSPAAGARRADVRAARPRARHARAATTLSPSSCSAGYAGTPPAPGTDSGIGASGNVGQALPRQAIGGASPRTPRRRARRNAARRSSRSRDSASTRAGRRRIEQAQVHAQVRLERGLVEIGRPPPRRR